MKRLDVRFVFPFALLASSLSVACSSSDSPAPGPPTDSGVGDGTTHDGDAFASDAPLDETDSGVDKLSAATLYKDFSKGEIADDAVPFEPAYQLWADGLVKRRWIQMPAGTKIDTSDMDNWKFPIGTKFWKEFAVAGGKILETRLIERQSDTVYRMGAYIWNDAQTDAVFSQAGDTNVLGTDHDIPDLSKCQACHNAAPGRINGFQAIQMSKPSGSGVDMVNIDWLVTNDWLTNPPPSGTKFTIPGDDTTRAGLGYLHANCGHCHNPNWEFFSLTNQVLRLTTTGLDKIEDTSTYKSTVYQATTSFRDVTYRIVPGDSADSCVYVRPTHRGDSVQMPPIASKHVDDTGVAEIKAFIDGLPKVPPPDGGVGDAGADTKD